MKRPEYSLLILEPCQFFAMGMESVAKTFPEIASVERASSFDQAFDFLRVKNFDLLLLHSIATIQAEKLIRTLREELPQAKVVLCISPSEHGEATVIPNQVLSGVISKQAEPSDFKEMFARLFRNEVHCDPQFENARRRLAGATGQRIYKDDLPTRRELDVLKAMAQGYSTTAIAELLNISDNTVETFRKRLILKFDARNSVDLVVKAISRGLIDIPA